MNIEKLTTELIKNYGTEMNVVVQLPPGSKCWEDSWTQFEISCVSEDGGTVYLQCKKD